MIKVIFFDGLPHKLEKELTLLEKLGQQVLSVVPISQRLGWWVTVRIPEDDGTMRIAFNLGVEACAECLEIRARSLRGDDDSSMADALDLATIELRMLKRMP